jgi:transposase InsO family protein
MAPPISHAKPGSSLLYLASSPASRRSRARISEAFVNTLKRDYVRVTPIPNAEITMQAIAGWFEDYNENHPHSGLKMRSPREVRSAQFATA